MTKDPGDNSNGNNRKRRKENDNYKIENDLVEHEHCCFLCFGRRKTNAEGSPSFWEKYLKKNKYTRVSFYKNNLAFFLTILAYLIVSLGLVALQLCMYWDVNVHVKFARIGGILLDFNSCLIIVLVLRRLTTWLRNTSLGRNYLPLDDFLLFHKAIGFIIVFFSIEHTIAHCCNLYYLSNEYLTSISKPPRQSYVSKIISSFNFLTNNNHSSNYSANQTSFKFNLNHTLNLTNLTSSEAKASAQQLAPTFAELMFTTKSGIGWVKASAMPTGWALLAILLIVVFFALPFVRQKGYFQIFYLTHWLHVVYYVILIIHATHFWKWFVLPCFLMVLERVLTLIRVKSVKYGETFIKDVNLLSSKVTNLVITRPKNFKFKSGDYLFINIPEIARYEWHPFTISSAPELKDELWLHVRSLGNWTNKLYEYFNTFSANPAGYQSIDMKHESKVETKYKKKMSNLVVMIDYKKSLADTFNFDQSENVNNIKEAKKIQINLNISNKIENIFMNISIDGPYGTSSRRIFDAEHAVLIAGGIGVTPFASILQSLWFKYSKSLKRCSNCNHQWYDKLEQKSLKKVDFIWVNRDYQSFEWFIELLGQLELQQLNSESSERFISIHLYMSSSKIEQEIKTMDNSLSLNDRENKNQPANQMQDFSLKLNPGRPDFHSLFSKISTNKKGKVDVFFCGTSDFGKVVQQHCIRHKFKFSKEYF